MPAVAREIGRVPGRKPVGHTVDGQVQTPVLHRHVLMGPRRVRGEFSRVHARLQGGAHELELDVRQDRGKDPPFPPGGVPYHVLPVSSQHHDVGAHRFVQESSD